MPTTMCSASGKRSPDARIDIDGRYIPSSLSDGESSKSAPSIARRNSRQHPHPSAESSGRRILPMYLCRRNTLYNTLRIKLTCLFLAVGKKFGLSNGYTGDCILFKKKSGKRRAGLFPTNTPTISCPSAINFWRKDNAWVKCPRPSPCMINRIFIRHPHIVVHYYM